MAIVIGDLRAILGLDSSSFQQGMQRAQASLKKTGEDMQRIGRSLSLKVTAPLAAFGGLSLKTAGEFQTAMNRVAAVSGATGDQLDAMQKQARQLGATTQFSASEAADAMGFLAMAGFRTNEIIGAMPDTLRLASAAQMDMASAADIVSNILAGYSMKVEDLGHANDVLVKSFTSSNTDLRQLGEAMKYAGPVASAAGVSFEEAAAALGMMGNAGIQGSMAGTSLRGAISRILSPTKVMAARMEEAGLAFTDAEGRLLPLADIVRQLEPFADDAGLMMELFGQRSGPAMAALVSQGADALRDMTGELQNSAGAADRVSKIQMEGLNGALKELRSVFEELQLKIAESGLLDWAESFVKWLTQLIQKVSQASPEMLRWGTVIAGVAATLGPLLIGLGFLLTALGPLAAGFAALAGPVGIAVAAIAGAAALIVTNWDTVGPFFTSLWEGVKTTFSGYGAAIIGLVTGDMEKARDGFKQAWEGIKEFWSTFWDGLVLVVKNVVPTLLALGGELIQALWDGMKAKMPEVKSWLKDQLNDAFSIRPDSFLGNVFRKPGSGTAPYPPGGVGTGADGQYSEGVVLGNAMREGMVEGLGNGREVGTSFSSDVSGGFREDMGIQSPSQVMIEYGQYISQGLGIGIQNGASGPISAMAGISDSVVSLADQMKSGFQSAFEGVVTGSMKAKDAVASLLQDLARMLANRAFQSLWGAVLGSFDPLAGALRGAGVAAVPAFAAGGMHGGGWRLVGENGPELEATGPARYFNAAQTRSMMGGGKQDVHVTVSVDRSGNLQAFVDRRADAAAQYRVGQSESQFVGRFARTRDQMQKRVD